MEEWRKWERRKPRPLRSSTDRIARASKLVAMALETLKVLAQPQWSWCKFRVAAGQGRAFFSGGCRFFGVCFQGRSQGQVSSGFSESSYTNMTYIPPI